MKKVLVTGAAGMLGKAVAETFKGEYEVIGVDAADFDITDTEAVSIYFKTNQPDIVINLAAYTNVDKCESRQDLAGKVNGEAPGLLAKEAFNIGAFFIQMSTDYVFDGHKDEPYKETDDPNPLCIYAKSKYQGELSVIEQARRMGIKDKYLIVRSGWLFGPGGINFVDSIIASAEKSETLKIVNDQKGRPTYTKDLSKALKSCVENKLAGVVHVANSGVTTWFDFAKEIFRQTDQQIELIPVNTTESARPAARPLNSVLDDNLFKERTGMVLRHWSEALRDYLAEQLGAHN